MKNQTVFSTPGTLEDLIFENRNKAYGAYELNRKNRKYLLIAFLVSLTGVSSAVAVPFIKAFHHEGFNISVPIRGIVELSDLDHQERPSVPIPPSPPAPSRQLSYVAPIVVEEGSGETFMPVMDELVKTTVNPPVEIQTEAVRSNKEIIPEEPEAPIFVEESASFMGGGLAEFRNWVIEHITYPEEAIEHGVFGKVIVEFTINAKGEVSNIKFIRSIDPLIDEETRRVIFSSPLWIPAKQGGIPVRQRFILPIVFQMN
jgi:periplasmic protein TonB